MLYLRVLPWDYLRESHSSASWRDLCLLVCVLWRICYLQFHLRRNLRALSKIVLRWCARFSNNVLLIALYWWDKAMNRYLLVKEHRLICVSCYLIWIYVKYCSFRVNSVRCDMQIKSHGLAYIVIRFTRFTDQIIEPDLNGFEFISSYPRLSCHQRNIQCIPFGFNCPLF